MKRTPTKKGTDRRKRPRGKSQSPKSAVSKSQKSRLQESCCHCAKSLGGADKALFVEEELGRTFCSEGCIAGFFTPEIERLEKGYFRRLSSKDLSAEERDSLNHLRWITLQEPDEAWREKTLTGDYRYTLISEFQPSNKKIWCVCICLCLRGEPSFLFMAFVTRNSAMANSYKKGERVQWVKAVSADSNRPVGEVNKMSAMNDMDEPAPVPHAIDGLASDWTEDETLRAKMTQGRRADDIPFESFPMYQQCLEETLETPDEVWSLQMSNSAKGRVLHLYHFIRYYPEGENGMWYVIVAREIDEEDQIEILDAFPTRDPELADRYRTGHQEVGALPEQTQNRIVH